MNISDLAEECDFLPGFPRRQGNSAPRPRADVYPEPVTQTHRVARSFAQRSSDAKGGSALPSAALGTAPPALGRRATDRLMPTHTAGMAHKIQPVGEPP